MITLKQVNYGYKQDKLVLRNINLQINYWHYWR